MADVSWSALLARQTMETPGVDLTSTDTCVRMTGRHYYYYYYYNLYCAVARGHEQLVKQGRIYNTIEEFSLAIR